MVKPYSSSKRVGKRPGAHAGIVIQNGDKQHWVLVAMSAASLLVTPILVAIITSNANQSSTSKDYVALAVNILNSKGSTPENRKWALSLLAKMSPVPFSSESEKQLAGGSGLTEPLKFAPMWGPDKPLVKKTSPVATPCLPVSGPAKTWSEKDTRDYIQRIGKAYRLCAINHQGALSMIDILQNTDKSKAQLEMKLDFKKYEVYKIVDE